MDTEIKKRKLKKADIGSALEMSDEERQISFYNRYFIFPTFFDVIFSIHFHSI